MQIVLFRKAIAAQVAELGHQFLFRFADVVEVASFKLDGISVKSGRQAVSQNGLDVDTESLDVDPGRENVRVRGLRQPDQVVFGLGLSGLGQVELLSHSVQVVLRVHKVCSRVPLMFSARGDKLLSVLLEQAHGIQDKLIVASNLSCASGDDKLGQLLVALVKVAHKGLGHSHQHRGQVLRVQHKVLGPHNLMQGLDGQVSVLLAVCGHEVGLGSSVSSVRLPDIVVQRKRVAANEQRQVLDRLVQTVFGGVPSEVLHKGRRWLRVDHTGFAKQLAWLHRSNDINHFGHRRSQSRVQLGKFFGKLHQRVQGFNLEVGQRHGEKRSLAAVQCALQKRMRIDRLWQRHHKIFCCRIHAGLGL
ncbi:hypothetical protein CLUG_02725 [Clavispora lusitaniae ATCC 42720]|uniref:Uncharacterized protein n=1 Tax=Clavispora lusitaniae (strain ATCC 42720) TaxID=306902 RepID=C4Y2G2_CLAL4|nr:uncharacterized protein CLUG_02725 [Clavispora lusitaniae ATCC 42720]EEQ38598.1 hypothetical protein CLUG_02725 [Clavispora lusitaniae ATCC 42720]